MAVETEQKFGIFDDILGIREDIPNIKLNQAFSPESENVILRYGLASRITARLKDLIDDNGDQVQTPDANPIIRIHRHYSTTDAIEYVFAFTKAHVYRWRQDTKAFLELFECSSDCELWSVVSFNRKIIITNWVDLVQVWDETTPSTPFAPLDTSYGLDIDGGSTYVTKAKYVETYEKYVIIGYTLEGGVVYPFRERWCSWGNEEDWQSKGGAGDASYMDFKEGSDRLKGFGHYTAGGTNLLIVFKESSSHFQWLVETAEIFQASEISNKIGLLATHSVINDKDGNLYYLASDYTIREIRQGIISNAIAKTVRSINPSYLDHIDAAFIDEYNQLIWTIPSSGTSTSNDKLIRFNLEKGIWETDTFIVRCFGKYKRQTSYTIDSLDLLYDTIDSMDFPYIDWVENVVGMPIDLCSDYSGYTFNLHAAEMDNSSSYTGKFVLTTDLTGGSALSDYKRISNMQFWFKRRESGIAGISAKEDNEANWQSLGTISIVDNNLPEFVGLDLPCDLRARHFLIKIEGENPFDFAGLIFTYEFDGEN